MNESNATAKDQHNTPKPPLVVTIEDQDLRQRLETYCEKTGRKSLNNSAQWVMKLGLTKEGF